MSKEKEEGGNKDKNKIGKNPSETREKLNSLIDKMRGLNGKVNIDAIFDLMALEKAQPETEKAKIIRENKERAQEEENQDGQKAGQKFFAEPEQASPSKQGLDLSPEKILSDRPTEFAQTINKAFNDVSSQGMEIFRYNGSGGDYGIAGVGNEELIASMLKTHSDQGKTSFTFMDIGAGYHGCADSIAEYINKNKDSFPNIEHVEIISLSGDNVSPKQETKGICRVSKISRFKIEEIERWLHPSDELIEVYEKLQPGSWICENLSENLKNIAQWADDKRTEVVVKIIQEGRLAEFSSSEIPDNDEREKANTYLEKALKIFVPLAEQYELNVAAFKEHYGVDIDIYKEKGAEEEISGLDLEEVDIEKLGIKQSSLQNEGIIYSNLIDNISAAQKIIKESDLQSKLGINAPTELATLKAIKAMNLPDSVDYATSSWCFRHLVDPAGTLIQTHNLLTPGTGMFHGDGFFLKINYQGEDLAGTDYDVAMRTLLHNLDVPYVYDRKDMESRRVGGYIVSRISEEPLEPNLQYKAIESVGSRGGNNWQTYSGQITTIEAAEDWVIPFGTYRASPYESAEVQLGINDLDVKYKGMWDNTTMWDKGVAMTCAKTALLIGKLKHEGISVGSHKLSDVQYKELFEFIREEYPDMPYVGTPLEAMTSSYVLYDTASTGTVGELQRLISQDPLNAQNRHMIFAAVENNRPDQVKFLLDSFNKETMTIAELKLVESIKLEAFERAIKAGSAEIVQLFTGGQVPGQYDAKETWELLKAAHPNNYRSNESLNQTNRQIIEHLLDNFKGDKQELWKLASLYPSFLSKKVQTGLNIRLVEKDIDKLLDAYIGGDIRKILDNGFATKEQLIEVNDLKKIELLTNGISFELYKKEVVSFEKLAQIDAEKLTSIIYQGSQLCKDGITTFDRLAQIDAARLKELDYSNVSSLCKKGVTTFEDLAKVDIDKLKIIIKRSKDIVTLVKDHGIKFDDLAKLDVDKLKDALGNMTFYGLDDPLKVIERVNATKSAIAEIATPLGSRENIDPKKSAEVLKGFNPEDLAKIQDSKVKIASKNGTNNKESADGVVTIRVTTNHGNLHETKGGRG